MNGISISTTIFGPKKQPVAPLAESLRQISEAGFGQVELSRKHTDLSEHSGVIADLGLHVWAVHGTLGVNPLLAGGAERRAAVEAEIRRMEDAAPFAPCPYVVHYLDRWHTVGEIFRETVAELVPKAAELGITLAIETVPDKPQNDRYPPVAEVAAFVRSFDNPAVSLCIDLNHSNIGEDLNQAIAACAGLLSTIHVSDNHGDAEAHLPPGEGVIDFASAFAALTAGGYDGPINFECHLPGLPTHTELVGLRLWAERHLGR